MFLYINMKMVIIKPHFTARCDTPQGAMLASAQ